MVTRLGGVLVKFVLTVPAAAAAVAAPPAALYVGEENDEAAAVAVVVVGVPCCEADVESSKAEWRLRLTAADDDCCCDATPPL